MKQPPESVKWEAAGTQGIGVLVSDTMMFERGGPHPSDANLGSFYGLAMPLVKRCLPIEPVQIENSVQKGFLDRYKVLLLTYEGQKPPTPEFHTALAEWVKAGGALVVVDDDNDAFNAVREWWNTAPMNYATPRLHLFEQLGLKPDATFPAKVGSGCVVFERTSPAALTYKADGAQHLRDLVQKAAEAVGVNCHQNYAMVLRRGPYVVAAGLDESIETPTPYTVHGKLVPLFDPKLPVLDSYPIKAGTRQLLLDLSALPADKIGVVAAACRVRDETVAPTSISFRADGLENSQAVVLLMVPEAPKSVTVDGKALSADAFEFSNGILRIRFTNTARGLDVAVNR
jgi:hypothetical protein